MKNFILLKHTILLFFLIIIFSTLVFSQKEHKVMLGCYFNGSATSPIRNTIKQINFNTDLQVGYFFTERIALGTEFSFKHQASSLIEPLNFSSRAGILPFIQIHPFKHKVIDWFLEVEAGLYFVNLGHFEQNGPAPIDIVRIISKSTDLSIGGGTGVNLFLTKKIAFSSSVKFERTSRLKGMTYYLHPYFSLKFGILALLGGKKEKE